MSPCVPLFLWLSATVDPAPQAVLDRITALSLKANLSFLASDALQGRNTPSPGLDIAAEFIASRFRKAGLEPVANGAYFQDAEFALATSDLTDFDLTIESGADSLHITKEIDLQIYRALDRKALELIAITKQAPANLAGKVAVLTVPQNGSGSFVEYAKLFRAVQKAKPELILLLSHDYGSRAPATRLLSETALLTAVPVVAIRDASAKKFVEAHLSGTASIHAKAASRSPVRLRNVAGVLRGSDPALSDSYVLLTAHYDHVGVLPPGEGDRIFNGANDDGSGTVSVVEIADALSQLPRHPRRSILFMTFFGEEKGLFGSRYYAEHPLFPLSQTVAQINLEQLGRTDDLEGPQVASATFTGFDYSDLPATFEAAGKATGIRVYKNQKNSDAFFARSDNQSLADAGIPAHTLAVAFEFPDYHKPGDEWQKIDYDNMAKVDRMIAWGLLAIANATEPPHWNTANPKTEEYRKATQK